MPPERWFFWAAAFLCAALAAAPMGAAGLAAGRCFRFEHYNSEESTVALRNRCSSCRKATVRYCDGETVDITVPAGGARRLNVFLGCSMKVVGARSCGEPERPRTSSKHRGRNKSGAARTHHPTAHAGPPADARPQAPKSAKVDGGGGSSPEGTDATRNLKENPVQDGSALNLQQTVPRALARPPMKSAVQRAVFPDTSAEDWDALLCSIRGQTLIHEADALLTRKEVLQVMLVEIWFSGDADKKEDERAAAQKEIQAIERELSLFEDRAKAIAAHPAPE